ncbi:hypothetical protein ACMD2_17234 [Ananas comosus]|uniref:Uncharacterized protein n=1 Tax=Ananas comosus TaxID=4615 RepID=A0A199W494_ANACO|nr:hypothetical protein ACMD2_17234 [Ananas comosus]
MERRSPIGKFEKLCSSQLNRPNINKNWPIALETKF